MNDQHEATHSPDSADQPSMVRSYADFGDNEVTPIILRNHWGWEDPKYQWHQPSPDQGD